VFDAETRLRGLWQWWKSVIRGLTLNLSERQPPRPASSLPLM